VNMTSSSGGSIDALRRPTRVVIAATKTGTEKNATVFARYWAEGCAIRRRTWIRTKPSRRSKPSILRAQDGRFLRIAEASGHRARGRRRHRQGRGRACSFGENGEGKLAAPSPWCGWEPTPPRRATPPSGRCSKEGAARTSHRRAEIRQGRHAGRRLQEQLTQLLLELARTQEALEK